MRRALGGVLALAGLTVREALRQKLWLLLVGAMALICVMVPGLDAVDDAARLKLAVAVITGVIGFVAVVLGILVAAAAVRRDLDERISFLLFSKPLSRLAFLGGRLLGLQAVLLMGIVSFCLLGTLSVGLQLGRFPDMRRVFAASSLRKVDRFGKRSPVPVEEELLTMSGPPDDAVEFHFTGLPDLPDGGAYDLLLRFRIRGQHIGDVVTHARLRVTATTPSGRTELLALHPDSPFGDRLVDDQPANPGEVVARNRPAKRTDLNQDYLWVVLPAELVEAGGVWVTVTRLDRFAIIMVDRETSCYLGTGGGSFFGNLLKGQLVVLAQAGLLCAVALLCISVSNLGVTLFASLTYYFAGCSMGILAEALRWHEHHQVIERLMGLLLWVLPDFHRYPVEARLAASQAVGWELVGSAWLYYGVHTLVFFLLAWAVLARREL